MCFCDHITIFGLQESVSLLSHSFPYSITVSPNYEITYLWFVQASSLVGVGHIAADTIFYACVCNLVGHYHIIQDRWAAAKLHHGSSASLSNEVRTLIVYHVRLDELANRMSAMYQPIMMVQFMGTSLLLCVIAYQLTLPNQELGVFFIYTFFLGGVVSQCFVYCFGGTTLYTESERLADSVYDVKWYNEPIAVQRAIIFCLARAQRPILIRTMFFAANLPTFSSVSVCNVKMILYLCMQILDNSFFFVQIISTTGSYIALLQSMSE